MKEIKVTIEPTGEVKIEALGFTGNACTKATETIERALGKPGKRTHKPEFYAGNQQQQKAGQG